LDTLVLGNVSRLRKLPILEQNVERWYQLAIRMRDRAERMLDWPLANVERNGTNGGTEHVTIQPSN
jgi:hypothetical protein